MNSSERLLLQFDDFNFDSKDYMYSITHCNSDWSVSDLHFTEYIDGFPENYIQTFDFSFNTKVSYVHYELVLPNSDLRFIKSGNYVLTVYDTKQSEVPLFTKRFMVYDDKLFDSMAFAFLLGTLITALICYVLAYYSSYVAKLPYKYYFPFILI